MWRLQPGARVDIAELSLRSPLPPMSTPTMQASDPDYNTTVIRPQLASPHLTLSKPHQRRSDQDSSDRRPSHAERVARVIEEVLALLSDSAGYRGCYDPVFIVVRRG